MLFWKRDRIQLYLSTSYQIFFEDKRQRSVERTNFLLGKYLCTDTVFYNMHEVKPSKQFKTPCSSISCTFRLTGCKTVGLIRVLTSRAK